MSVDWSDLGVACGLMLTIEGAAYAIAPDFMRRLLALVLGEPVARLRVVGAMTALVGLLIVWLIRT
ncbi:MAG: DUF2065 domain-containing protein [Rhodothalassiaceae bacterium]